MIAKSSDGRVLRFLWWNVQDFSHFDHTRAGETRWPISPLAYSAKCAAIDRVLLGLQPRPHLIGMAEITKAAALELRDRLFPGYRVFSLDLLPQSRPQVAFIYSDHPTFQEVEQLSVPDVPRTTRPMAVLDYLEPGHRVRFIACHWPPRFDEQQERTRILSAHKLATYAYSYLHEPEAATKRHLVILGDLNEEPFGSLESFLGTTRSRARSRRREHFCDGDTRRVHLYNCSWRLLGERAPHAPGRNVLRREAAGTYYWREERSWHTLDHVIVNGSLLCDCEPYLDESSLDVHLGSLLESKDGLPRRFEWRAGDPTGVSDHLPIRGQIVLERRHNG